MNKNEFLKAVADATGLTNADSAKAYDAIFSLIISELKSGEKVSINGFGVFDVKDKPEREGRNPFTGETIKIGASKSVSFKASKNLKESLNK